LAVLGIQIGEVLVVELVKQDITDEAVDRILVEQRADQRLGVGRDRLRWLGFEAHRIPPRKQLIYAAWYHSASYRRAMSGFTKNYGARRLCFVQGGL